ncbi:DUF1761 domain-containing protein [Polaribacter tangerinus]|uniref:DUF1761 domain-containing protein n=1 Tax=Polaribacter tangerinus TaxID=1920034 RepID=UPI000B4B537A|nr:DUF1761 domain-containing protein [Polaribacter tangerinus]
MDMNFSVLFISAIIPMFIGFIWYGPLFGNAWMNQMGFTKESLEGTNMVKVLIICYVVSILIASALMQMVIHQMGVYSTLAGEPGFSEGTGSTFSYFQDFLAQYGDRFRTFKHGAFHGILYGLFLVTPILSIQAMFERKGFKYIALNAGYWIVTLAIMAGVIAQWV